MRRDEPVGSTFQMAFSAVCISPNTPDAVYRTRGSLGPWCAEHLPGTRYTYLCAEFGTYSSLAVLHGLLGSVGSDLHDPQLTWTPLGRSLKLPDCVTPVWRSYIKEAAMP